ncbi:hypothetical protein MO867_16615 [Microbulbifer sp. OS29]|uniref:Lipoprotein n=1 Tax=Microbulbifer okhotskensis TaxID=2926617 RepID=A0A9X2EUX1_9GAMM|nr:hypothetical protein [Microbulbifer okhotskensis]MCO1335958.1 hypothetical protein [Microbulbifer okhotskensis]
MKGFTTIVLSLLILSGCTGNGTKPLGTEDVSLGVDTEQTIKEKLGKPYEKGVFIKNNQQIVTLAYAYPTTGSKADKDDVSAARNQGFYFFNNKLVGQDFVSSLAEDSTDFDESKVPLINEGHTSISEAQDLLGNPSGEYQYPLISNPSEKAKVYMYSQTSKAIFQPSSYQKILIVSYNTDGIVTHVEFAEIGNKHLNGQQ